MKKVTIEISDDCYARLLGEVIMHIARRYQEGGMDVKSKLFEIVKRNGAITRSNLTRMSQWTRAAERTKAIDELIRDGLMFILSRKPTTYKAIL